MADLDTNRLRAVLTALASRLPPGADVEVLIVGGAAALLGGLLPPEMTTVDCDVAAHPRQAWSELQRAAEEVAVEHRLSRAWLNAECQESTVRRLPERWRDRAVVHRFGRLTVLAIARLDWIAMKLIAGREKDIEHLRYIEPLTDEEIAFARDYLDDLEARFAQEAPFAQDARVLLDDIERRRITT